MKRTVKILSMLLAVIFVLTCFVGCSEKEEQENDTSAPAVTTEESRFVKDDLPEAMDFQGKDLIVQLNLMTGFGDFAQDGMSSNAVENEIYAATQRVNARLNINIQFVNNKYAWDDRGTTLSKVCADIMTGVSEFDVTVGYPYLPMYGGSSLFCDLAQLDYISLDKPWYNQGMRKLFGEKVYDIKGDGTLIDTKWLSCVFFNQDALNDKGISDDLYTIAKNGEWTLERLETLIKDTYYSADGTDSRNEQDYYGVTFGDNNAITPLGTCMGVRLFTRQNDGTYSYEAGSVRNVTIMDKAINFVTNNNNVLNCNNKETEEYKISSDEQSGVSRIFASGRSLFMFGKFENAGVLIRQESIKAESLGILPYPKYDTNQDYYAAGRAVTFLVPISAVNKSCSGAFIEAWSSDFYRTVVPKYFEDVLQLRYSSGERMSDMFDFIRSKQTMTFEAVFEDGTILSMGNTAIKLAIMGQSGGSWSNISKRYERQSSAQLEKIMKAYGLKTE